MTIRLALLVAAVVALAAAAAPAMGVRLVKVADGFDTALFVTSPPGDSRQFVVEQGGTIKVLKGGTVEPTPFLDISSRVRAGGEQGLLGLAFHPKYATNGRFFVNYTNGAGHTVVAEYRVSAADPDVASRTERRLLFIRQPASNHNGGMVAFGPDGFLYIGMGDGGGGGDTYRTSQNLGTLLAKMVRIDVNGSVGSRPYRVPATNPFVGRRGVRPEIFALGLRNPWRFSFDRARGDLWIGDVGQNRLEEINWSTLARARGANYGWNRFEGRSRFSSTRLAGGRLIGPVAQYSHASGCSVTGGYVYRGTRVPALRGRYLYGDFCSSRIWTIRAGARAGGAARQLLTAPGPILSFGEDPSGEVYVVTGDSVLRFAP